MEQILSYFLYDLEYLLRSLQLFAAVSLAMNAAAEERKQGFAPISL